MKIVLQLSLILSLLLSTNLVADTCTKDQITIYDTRKELVCKKMFDSMPNCDKEMDTICLTANRTCKAGVLSERVEYKEMIVGCKLLLLMNGITDLLNN